mgnify:CR=1 FL=1
MTSLDRILITGGAGFIGSNFTHHILDQFEEIYVLDKLTYAGDLSNLESIRDEISFVQADIRDSEVVSELYTEVNYVVNFAAASHVDRSIESGSPFVKNNVEGAYSLMENLREHDIKRFIQISTDEVYGSYESGEASEDDPLDPSSPYSASKASTDLFVNACWETYDLPITIVRPTNIYGPRQHTEKLIPKFISRAIQEEPLPLYGDGTNVRQWLYVHDFCNALQRILEDGRETVYNIAGPDRKSNLEVTRSILDRLGKPHELIEFVEDRKGHDYRYALSDEKIRKEIDLEPFTPFEEGLVETVEWYHNQIKESQNS